MNRLLIASIVLAGAASAAAQSAPLPGFLEARVPQELAADGVLLARQNLTLDVEPAGSQLRIALVDATTGEPVIATTLSVPTDRDAAVASVTHVVAELANQVAMMPAPAPAPPPPTGPVEVVVREDEREVAYRREALHFGERIEYASTSHGGVGHPVAPGVVRVHGGRTTGVASRHTGWPALRGELDEELTPTEFYDLVGRADLADRYRTRRNVAIGGLVVGGASVVLATALVIKGGSITANTAPCEPLFTVDTIPSYNACVENAERVRDDGRRPYFTSGAIAAGVGVTSLIVGAVVWKLRHPVSENEAKVLADDYNARLRKKHGLSMTTYVEPTGGGFALAGSF